jgi:uncharacterized membrane protein (UPF0127 family)
MKSIHVTNLTHSTGGMIQAMYCESFFCKLRGLIFRSPLQPNQGLLLVSSRESRLDVAIHMIGVSSDLTIVWINHDLTVVDVQLAHKNQLASFPAAPAQYALELHPERMRDYHKKDQLRFDEIIDSN